MCINHIYGLAQTHKHKTTIAPNIVYTYGDKKNKMADTSHFCFSCGQSTRLKSQDKKSRVRISIHKDMDVKDSNRFKLKRWWARNAIIYFHKDCWDFTTGGHPYRAYYISKWIEFAGKEWEPVNLTIGRSTFLMSMGMAKTYPTMGSEFTITSPFDA